MRYLLLLFLFFFLFDGFSQELIPLKVGNTWVYEQQIKFSNGSVKRDTVVNEVLRDTIIENEVWYVLREFGNEFIVQNRGGDQYEYWDKPMLFFKNPKESLGQSYEVGEVNSVQIGNDVVKINNFHGNNKCYHYSITQEGIELPIIEVFIAPEMGVVHHSWLIDGHIIESQLIDFDLKN